MSCTVTKEVKEVEVTGTVDVSEFVWSLDIDYISERSGNVNYSVVATICSDDVKEWDVYLDAEVEAIWKGIPLDQRWNDLMDLIEDDFQNQI